VRLRVLAGGAPAPAELAALSAALTTVIDEERAAPADPTPAAYRSRWRRAALIESTDTPSNLKADSPPWGAR